MPYILSYISDDIPIGDMIIKLKEHNVEIHSTQSAQKIEMSEQSAEKLRDALNTWLNEDERKDSVRRHAQSASLV